jgi:hypothetical protein
MLEEEIGEEEEVLDEVKEEESTETEEEVKEESVEEDSKDEEPKETPRELALRKEVERLKADRRERKIDSNFVVQEKEEEATITRAEARLFESWRAEVLDEFLDKNPEYRENEDLWSSFVREYEDRVPEVQYAEKKKIPITKQLFKERMNSIHRSLGMDTVKAKEEGKKELLKTQSTASVYASGSGTGEKTQATPKTAYSQRERSFLARYGVK